MRAIDKDTVIEKESSLNGSREREVWKRALRKKSIILNIYKKRIRRIKLQEGTLRMPWD